MKAMHKVLLRCIREVCGDKTPLMGCEVGVWEGELSAVLLKELPTLTLVMVDRWMPYLGEQGDTDTRLAVKSREEMLEAMNKAMIRTDFANDRRIVIAADSVRTADLFERCFDFVFIDGCHTYEGVSRDLLAYYDTVFAGGLFAGHDYGGPGNRKGWFGVNRAVDEFAEKTKSVVKQGGGISRVWYWQK